MRTIITNREHLAHQRVARRGRRGRRAWLLAIPVPLLIFLWLLWPSARPEETGQSPASLPGEGLARAAALPLAPGPPGPAIAAPTPPPAPDADAGEEALEENYEDHVIDPDGEGEAELAEDQNQEEVPYGPFSLAREEYSQIEPGETLGSALGRLEIREGLAHTISRALKDVYDFRRLKPGTAFEIHLDVAGNLEFFQLYDSPLETFHVDATDEGFRGYKIAVETTMFVEPISGVIEQSLAHSIWMQGEGDALTAAIASIFAWDVDFFSDMKKGDEWHVLVEKHYVGNRFVRYGDVLCAKLKGQTIGTRYAYYFDSEGGKYYDDQGMSMEKGFLRAPLDTTRVTSKFGFRMHPTLGKKMQHNGVDYGAPTGTPVWAVAAGTVTAAARMGPCGLGVKVRHDQGYESIYCHLNSMAVRPGQKLRQKALVGRVGCTGRCTGPHLHFGLKQNGKYVDPQKITFIPGRPIARNQVDRWKAARALLKGKLDAMEPPVFFGPPRPPDYEPPGAELATGTVETPPPARRKSSGFRPRPEGIKAVRVP